MIYGQLDKLEEYISEESGLSAVVSFLKENDLIALSVGRHEINGKFLYVNIDEYDTQLFKDRNYEIHQQYIDVQCILDGQESIYIEKGINLEEKVSYDAEKDIVFLQDGMDAVEVKMHANDFLVIYPEEAHKPCVQLEQPCHVKKAVFKIAIGEV